MGASPHSCPRLLVGVGRCQHWKGCGRGTGLSLPFKDEETKAQGRKVTRQHQVHSESKPGLSPSSPGTAPLGILLRRAPLVWSINHANRPERLGEWVKLGKESCEREGWRRCAGVVSCRAGYGRPSRAPYPSAPARTHFAESVLMEPVTSMSPARNSWYLVQAMAAEVGNTTLQIPRTATSAIT